MFGNEPYTIINNGIDFDGYHYSESSRRRIREELDIPSDCTLLCHVGTFYPVKNHSFLIDIFYEYTKLNPNAMLLLVGDGHLKNTIKDKITRLGIAEKVIFAGVRNDMNSIYSASDIYVMPSFSEGISMSLCEAQINGLKCYTSENVDEGSNISGNVDFISLSESAQSWANIIYNNSHWDENVTEKISNKFTLNNSANELFKYYNSIK